MRSILVFAILTMVGPATSACPAPRPTVDQLTLVTASGTAIPSDGGLLVQRNRIMANARGDDAAWTVREKGTRTAVAVTIDPLGDRYERWTFATAADRELEIVNRAGKVIAVVQQRAAAAGKLPAPRAERMTSTLVDRNRSHAMAIPAATMVAQVAGKPASARLLVVMYEDQQAAWPVHAFDATAAAFEWIVYGGKGCGGGSMPLAVGDRVSLAWIDAAGRRSPATRVVVAKAPQK
jgi:hypothetical protein